MKKKKFIVASASPRRKELLLAQGFDFEVVPSDANENIESETSAYDTVKQLSKLKAESVCKKKSRRRCARL